MISTSSDPIVIEFSMLFNSKNSEYLKDKLSKFSTGAMELPENVEQWTPCYCGIAMPNDKSSGPSDYIFTTS
jgi:hypothetical protein